MLAGQVSGNETLAIDNKLYDPSVMSVPLPNEENGKGVVHSGKTTLVPLWIRGDRIGKHTFKFLFSYQSEVRRDKEKHGVMLVRAHRMIYYHCRKTIQLLHIASCVIQ